MIVRKYSQLEVNGIEDLDIYSITTTVPTFDGLKYKFILTYNKIDGHVYLDVEDIDENRIVSGVRLVHEADVIVASHYKFDGKLAIFCVPTTEVYDKTKVSVEDLRTGNVVIVLMEGDRDDG